MKLTDLQELLDFHSMKCDLSIDNEVWCLLGSIKVTLPDDFDLVMAEITNDISLSNLIAKTVARPSTQHLNNAIMSEAKKWLGRELQEIAEITADKPKSTAEICCIEVWKRSRAL